MAKLALTHGFSAFILMTDDPAQIERFAGEAAPAVRAQVATERARLKGQPRRRV